MHATTRYKGQRNLAKGDIAWVIISCRYLPSYSPSGSRPHEVGLARCTNLQRLWRSETGEKGGCGGQRSYRSKERWPFPVGSPLWSLTIALSRPFSHNLPFECLRRSNHFRAKRMEERCKTNFKALWGGHGAVVYKRKPVDIFCRLSTMHERDKHSATPMNGMTSIAIGEIACQRYIA